MPGMAERPALIWRAVSSTSFGQSDVQLDGHNARQRDAPRIPRTGVDFAGAAREGRARERESDAAIGAGNENCGALEFHGAGSFWRRLKSRKWMNGGTIAFAGS
jgi:hypothetical protein